LLGVEGINRLASELPERLQRDRIGGVALELDRDELVMACARDGAHTRIERAGASFSFFVIKRAPESFFTSSQSARQEIIPPDEGSGVRLVGRREYAVVGALDEAGHVRCALDLPEVGFAELDRLGRLVRRWQEARRVIRGDVVELGLAHEGQSDGRHQPDENDEPGATRCHRSDLR
jgi:hypothetical protein